MEETYPEAAAVLQDAGWTPHDTWGVFTRGSLIMGSPGVGEFHVKNLDAAPDSPDTPDDPVAAAEWLVARFPVAVVTEPEETPAHEDDAETGAAEVDESAGDGGVEQEQSSDPGVSADADFELSDDQSDFEGGGGEDVAVDLGAEILDADFYEPTDRVGEFRIKNIAHSPDSPDTPDDPVAAALWLVAHEPVAVASEPEETPAHEDDAETGADGDAAQDEGQGVWDGGDTPSDASPELAAEPLLRDSEEEVGQEPSDVESLGSEILDADFYEPTDPLIEGADFAEAEDYAGGAFIFGDNLHQLRTSAIGLVVQAALERMPLAIDYARMSELRNFTMGVSEGRWPDDPDKREELDTLEATERLRRAVEAARDTKVAALLSATREEIEAFDVEDGWPA